MSSLVRLDHERRDVGPPSVRITLTAPRANALEPALLAALHEALDEAERIGAGTILLCGGRNFSSGGDVRRFEEAVGSGRGEAHARAVVGSLQALVLRLLEMPRLVAVAARGAVTGGAAGLLFVADIAVLDPGSFVQPCYAQVGFAPDGGWTALLPERIGAGRALDWLASDRRLGAAQVLDLGLCRAVGLEPEEAARASLGGTNVAALIAAKRLIWDAPRRASVAARLEAETEAFVARLSAPDVQAGMRRFLAAGRSAHA